jgi:hypothetical protein
MLGVGKSQLYSIHRQDKNVTYCRFAHSISMIKPYCRIDRCTNSQTRTRDRTRNGRSGKVFHPRDEISSVHEMLSIETDRLPSCYISNNYFRCKYEPIDGKS